MVRVHSSRYLKLELDTNRFQLLFCHLILFGKEREQIKKENILDSSFFKNPVHIHCRNSSFRFNKRNRITKLPF